MGNIHWGRVFRRGTAVCLAAVTLWLVVGAAGGWAGELEGSETFVTAALRTELGQVDSPLSFWQRLAVSQSLLLERNPGNWEEQAPEPQPTTSPDPLPNAQPAPDHDDETGQPPATAAPENIVERTLTPVSSEGYATGAGLYLYNRTDREVDLASALYQDLPFSLSPASEGPQILIVHTHTTEAYTPDDVDVYAPSDNNTRTLEEPYNMLRVGDEMEAVFTEMGLSVIHDRGVYDYPAYNGAYSRSGAAVEEYLKQYPTIQIILDVHRDALVGSDGTVYKAVTTVDRVKTAQVMVVVGTDAGGADHPGWRDNLALAAKLQKNLDTLYPTLARPLALRKSAYNQALRPGSLLVEVGTHGNTLQEALAGARDFARAAGAVFLGLIAQG